MYCHLTSAAESGYLALTPYYSSPIVFNSFNSFNFFNSKKLSECET